MQGVKILQKTIDKRLNLIESFLLICSFNDTIQTDFTKLYEKHNQLSKQQKQVTVLIMRTLRIDDTFKKQFHKFLSDLFYKLDKRWIKKRQRYGKCQQIICDYIDFFTLLKQKYIIEFLVETFKCNVYNYTNTIFILLEILYKYLRIKTQCILKKIINRNSIQEDKIHLKNIQTYIRKRGIDRFQGNCKQQINYNINYQNKSLKRKILTQFDQRKSKTKYIGINQKQLTLLSRKQNNQSPNNSKPHRRRVINSFKNPKMVYTQENFIFERYNTNDFEIIPLKNTQPKTIQSSFYNIFSEEYFKYTQIIDLPDSTQIDPRLISIRIKNQWINKNYDKLIVQICQRNQHIRKTVDDWIQTKQWKIKDKRQKIN